ncbi:hypothetical protein KI688_009698 [Linnemannia hyalina]|uniref:Uncharacterized protein n=1 Tax=Linnemannia hyalina TaxID=64524 RepID=A0A9P8BWM5_9FUNG|nr:hypothetical protein KI688_009698 [Linnemannia hyalina]
MSRFETPYILRTLSHIFDKPDESRLAHTASAPLTGSVLLRVYFKLGQLPRHPDLVVRYHEIIDIGVGEVSLSASISKVQGDLARTLLWSKRAADEVVTRFEETEDMNLLFVQVIGQTCNLYLMCRVGTVCVATKIGTIQILYTLSDTLSFEDQVQTWLTLDKPFNSTVSVLNDATYRRQEAIAQHLNSQNLNYRFTVEQSDSEFFAEVTWDHGPATPPPMKAAVLSYKLQPHPRSPVKARQDGGVRFYPSTKKQAPTNAKDQQKQLQRVQDIPKGSQAKCENRGAPESVQFNHSTKKTVSVTMDQYKVPQVPRGSPKKNDERMFLR